MVVIKNYDSCKKLNIMNEYSLQKEIVKFLKKSDLLFSCTHTSTMLQDAQSRREAHEMGYRKGMPDIIIYTPNNKYNIMCIELKSPWSNGTLSQEQEDTLNILSEKCRSYCLVSNDYCEVIEKITKYRNNIL